MRKHTHLIARGRRPRVPMPLHHTRPYRGRIHPSHKPICVICGFLFSVYLRRFPRPSVFVLDIFPVEIHTRRSPCPAITHSISLCTSRDACPAAAHLFPLHLSGFISGWPSCPEGTRLEEANVRNRGCLSRRETYLRTRNTHTYPRPEGGTSQLKPAGRFPQKRSYPIFPTKKSALICAHPRLKNSGKKI